MEPCSKMDEHECSQDKQIKALGHKLDLIVTQIDSINEKLSFKNELKNEIEINHRANIRAEEKINDFIGKAKWKKTINIGRAIGVVAGVVIITIALVVIFNGLKAVNYKLDMMGTPIKLRNGNTLLIPSDTIVKK